MYWIIRSFFRTDLLERKRRFPSWVGAEKNLQHTWILAKKRHFCCDWSRTLPDWSEQPWLRLMKGVTVGYAIKPKQQNKTKNSKTTSRHRNTVEYIAGVFFIYLIEGKIRFNVIERSQISVFYFSYKVSYFQWSAVTRHRRIQQKADVSPMVSKLLYTLSS